MRPAISVFVAMAALLAMALRTWADEEEIPWSMVPKQVLDAVDKKFPGAQLIGATREKEGQEIHYNITLKHTKEDYEVCLTSTGEIVEIAEDIYPKEMPVAVHMTINKRYPRATIKDAAEITHLTDNHRISYWAEIHTTDSRIVEMTLEPNGKILTEKFKEAKKKKK